ncbi:hypothetical protein [Aeromicrobium sp.]|uniref:hypothetical protein n=1 Tax=Aeromicrobium sp. TaxID=1871063 RepID=UPI0025C0658C|nr:hypothetical protein [Aeromicrobium sp.]MCK5891380.1 hypothetical protein [Aeromicrobium sp.]
MSTPTSPPPVPPAPAWAHPWPAPAPPLPVVPGSTAGVVVGIVALAGGLVLLLPLVVAPIAWYLGARAHRRAEREPDRWRPAGTARTAMVLGMVGSGILAVVSLLAVVIATLTWVAIATPSPY